MKILERIVELLLQQPLIVVAIGALLVAAMGLWLAIIVIGKA